MPYQPNKSKWTWRILGVPSVSSIDHIWVSMRIASSVHACVTETPVLSVNRATHTCRWHWHVCARRVHGHRWVGDASIIGADREIGSLPSSVCMNDDWPSSCDFLSSIWHVGPSCQPASPGRSSTIPEDNSTTTGTVNICLWLYTSLPHLHLPACLGN